MGMPQYLMGIDIGSYESKGVLTDLHGKVLARHAIKHELQFLKPGFVEQDVEKVWWGEFVELTKVLVEGAKIDAKDVMSVGLSGIYSMVPVDKNADPLRSGGIMYGVDTRSVKEIDEVLSWHGEEKIFKRTGNGLSAQSMGPKILWVKKNEPAVYSKAHSFIPCANFIAARLTGNFNIDHLTAGFFGPCYDPAKLDWDDELCKGIVEPGRLPRPRWATESAGRVTAAAAARTGLAEGTVVSVGTCDVAGESMSIGVTQPGDMMLMYGSTAWITLLMNKPLMHEQLWATPYIFPNTYCLHGGMATSGSLTRWFRDMIAPDAVAEEKKGGPDSYSVISEAAAKIAPGADGLVVLPYFSGERSPINDADARGMIFGLDIGHTRAHLYRAAYEGVGYSINHTLQVMARAGAKAELMTAVGGGTKNSAWLQTVSDITKVPQRVPSMTMGASYGNCFIAGFAAGIFTDPRDISKWVATDRTVKPNLAHAGVYEKRMNTYLELYTRTKDLMHATSQEARGHH
jgi:xylulokinase